MATKENKKVVLELKKVCVTGGCSNPPKYRLTLKVDNTDCVTPTEVCDTCIGKYHLHNFTVEEIDVNAV